MAPRNEKSKETQNYNNKLSAKTNKPFKKSNNDKKFQDKDTTGQVSASLLVQDDDPEFPRGGGNILTREERAEAYAEAEAEFEREGSGFNKGKGKRNNKKDRKKISNDGGDELGSLFGDGITGRLPKFANRITLKNISPKMKFWGVVVEVNEKDLVISLPRGLRGYVHAEDASDIVLDNKINDQKDSKGSILSSIFYAGQLVSCTILKVDDESKEGKTNKKILVSLRLSLIYSGLTLDAVKEGMVLTAQVKSVEDHGYILHFGVPSFTGFLPRSGQGISKFCKGQLIQCTVKGIDKARSLVYLNSDFDTVAKYAAKDLKGLSIDLLIPGMMVSARIHSTLENGIMLSFLTYFTGTADIFNLQSPFLTGSWKDEYKENKKVNARILFIDPSTRAIGLTLNSHLISYKAPPLHIKMGEIYDNSRILRVDRGFGLLLEVPSSPKPSPAYVSISDVADEEGLKLEKKFREGTQVRVRVTGFKYLEGIATGTLKDSALEGSVFAHSDVKPGMLLKAKVIAVQDFGAIVQCPSGIKALCPLPHMSELEIIRPSKKFKVGAELLFRVLGCKSKRITVTHKKTLVKSKLKILASYADASEGVVTHGWIAKIEKHGCFVKFYNGVEGFAHKSELALDPGSKADDVYHVGQVVKCRVLASLPTSHRVSLSFVISPKRSNVDDDTKIGSVVSGVVERLTEEAIIVCVDNTCSRKGMISNEHLADHNVHTVLFRSLLKPGYKFEELLVLDIDCQNLVLSAKHSLISNYQDIPSDVAQISPLSVVHGYICNVIEAGCFVRFLGRLTGFSPKEKATDGKTDNLLDAFYVGQSVRSHILNVNNETARIKLGLKQSLCFSTNVSFIKSYFSLEEKIAKLQNSDVKSLTIGAVVKVEVQERKDFGIVLSFKEYPDVVGFVANHQLGEADVEKGSTVEAFVLDISNTEGVVDLSLKQEFISNKRVKISSKKKRQQTAADLELGKTVTAVVEIIKDNYLVLSIPEQNHAIGYALIMDYNTQKLSPRKFDLGQSILVTVGELPNPDSCNRLLLLVKPSSHTVDTSSSKRARKASNYAFGSLVDVEVIDIKPLELLVKFGHGVCGRIHITEVTDGDDKNPLAKFKIGQLINARIVANASKSKKQATRYAWELSLRNLGSQEDTDVESKFSAGNLIRGYVKEVSAEWLWLTVSRKIRGQLYILDSSCEPSELQEFQKRYSVGQLVQGYVLKFLKDKRTVRMTPYLPSHIDNVSDANGANNIQEGYIIGGKISKILPGVGGLVVQIGPHLHGRIHYTELVDEWVPHPLSVYEKGQFVKCKVLEASKSSDGLHIDLSLRASQIGDSAISIDKLSSFERATNVDSLQPKMEMKGYVKNTTSKGCFVMLSRKLDARILISNLSDEFVETPEKEFPIGSLVHGRVLSVDSSSKKVNLTLKREVDSETKNSDAFANVKVGEIVSGVVKGVEAYGVFIRIDHTNLVGLCHISEVSDEHTASIEDIYTKGDKVVAKVLQVDKERHRISLGMKKSYIVDTDTNNDNDTETKTDNLNDISGDSEDDEDNDETLLTYFDNSENDDDAQGVIIPAESRASINPLPVKFEDSEGSDMDDGAENQNIDSEQVSVTKKSDRRDKKKAKEQRELEISAAEERMLRKDAPQSEDEFEKLVRASPNSSYVWVQYMAFMEKVGDVDKARSIAERALRTINFREEDEKLNIWIAYFNLENRYGNPPEEAVKKVFVRAMQSLDHKKVYFALLGVYERTEQYKLAEEIYERMSKEYKTSCKIWLHRVQSLLKQNRRQEIQSIVNQALLCLPRKKHIKFISQSAILEFKCGEPESGRTKFEGILREYPKRTDLWSVYIDQEIRLGDQEVIQALFERVTSLSLPPRKIEFLFKKYLNYEKSQGDEDRIEYVKRKAIEYAESLK